MLRFQGTAEEAEYFAMSPDLDYPLDEDDE